MGNVLVEIIGDDTRSIVLVLVLIILLDFRPGKSFVVNTYA